MTQSGGEGSGVIYKLDPAGHYTVLHSFSPADDGLAAPDSVLVQDAAGNLYGTTQAGGAAGVGAAYELDTAGSLTILYSFPPRAPSSPIRNMSAPGLTIDPAGNLFGVVEVGTGTAEGGLVYMLNAARAETTIYSFSPAPGGTSPFAGVVLGAAGNLYGTTSSDDTPGSEPNWGLVYQVDPAGNEQVLYNFTGGADGGYPQGGVIRDAGGRLYGTAWSGGAANLGVVFELSPSGKQTVLHSFTGGSDGQQPVAGVIRDADGNLYGTTPTGGNTACDGGCGVVFKIDPSGQESILYSFTGGEGGSAPLASLTQDSEGNLYGTAF